jgi:hypothetical protein
MEAHLVGPLGAIDAVLGEAFNQHRIFERPWAASALFLSGASISRPTIEPRQCFGNGD